MNSRRVKVGTKRAILYLTLVLLASILAGCGSGAANSNPSSQPANPQATTVSISFQPAPVKSMFINGVLQLTAIVSNDSTNSGVDWCVATPEQPCGGSGCPPEVCGSVNQRHTQSGESVTFTPPTALVGNTGSVTIIAFATADHKQNVLAPITVSGFDGNLNGRYVFQAKGARGVPGDAQSERPYQITGVVSLDGNGGVTLINVSGSMVAEEQTSSDSAGFASANIIGGTYFLGSDGRGTLTIKTDNSTIGVNGSETFSLSFVSSSQLFINQADGTASASGTMDLQTSTSAPARGYAFTASGTDGGNSPMALGGILNIDQSNGGISGTGSVVDQHYLGILQNCQGPVPSGGGPGISGSVSAPDIFGVVRLSLSTCFSANARQFNGYLVDNQHIKLIEIDLDSKTNRGFATAGVALGQGSATGTFSGSQAFTGNYVFGISSFNGSESTFSVTAAGLLSTDGTGTLGGRADEVLVNSVASSVVISDGLSASYTVDPSGTGRVDVPATFNKSSNSTVSAPELIFYLSGSRAPALVLNSDLTAPTVGMGMAFPQAESPIPFVGKYGFQWFNLTQESSFGQSGLFAAVDASGNMQVGPTTNTVSGSVDFSSALGQKATQTELSGSLPVSLSTVGSFGGNLTALFTGLGTNTVSVNYYLADSNHGFFIETDSLSPLLLGYFAARTPVCPTCP